jgi:methionine-rich copper-binding protein CopC
MASVFMQSRGRSRLIRISVWVAVLGLLLSVLSSLVLASAAEAHASLLKTVPANGSVLHEAPSQVVLTFSEPVSASFATVSVTDDSGRSVGQGKAAVNGSVVTQALAPDLGSSGYVVTYRVISDDGHPVSDTTTFTLALPSASSGPNTAAPTPHDGATTPAAAPATASGSAAGSSPMVRLGLAVGVGTLALAAGTALVAASRRRQAS